MSLAILNLVFRYRWSSILLLALLVRILWACGLQYLLDHHWHRQFLIEGDANGYWELAQTIAEGRDYAIYSPPRYVLRMPGFPALLAVSMMLFGESLLAARLLLVLVGTAACGLVYVLGKQLFDQPTACLAALLAALSPVLVGFTPVVLCETTFAVCLLGGLISAVALLQELNRSSPRMRAVCLLALLTGVFVSAGCFMRPSWLLWGPVTAFTVFLPGPWLQQRDRVAESGQRPELHLGLRLVATLLVILGLVGPLVPWGLRNKAVTGHFVLTTLWMGPSLYDGLNPQATGDSDMRFFDEENLMATLSEYEVNEEYKKRAWAFARENPGRALELAWVKWLRYWSPVPNAEQFGNVWLRLVVALGTIPLFGLAAWGAWHHRRRLTLLLLCLGPVLYFCALHLLFVSSLRYRLPAEYPLLILSAAGARSLWNSRSEFRPSTQDEV